MEEYGTIYYGTTCDGSDAKPLKMHISSCGSFWGGQVFTKQKEKQLRKMQWKKRIANLKNTKPTNESYNKCRASQFN